MIIHEFPHINRHDTSRNDRMKRNIPIFQNDRRTSRGIPKGQRTPHVGRPAFSFDNVPWRDKERRHYTGAPGPELD